MCIHEHTKTICAVRESYRLRRILTINGWLKLDFVWIRVAGINAPLLGMPVVYTYTHKPMGESVE